MSQWACVSRQKLLESESKSPKMHYQEHDRAACFFSNSSVWACHGLVVFEKRAGDCRLRRTHSRVLLIESASPGWWVETECWSKSGCLRPGPCGNRPLAV